MQMQGDGATERWDDIDYPDVDADLAYDPSIDNPLIQPGSDGLIEQGGTDLLREMWRRREQGASLDQLRRDAGQIDPFTVSNRTLENAIMQGRRLEDYATRGRITEAPRRFRGITVRPCPACGRRVLTRALRRAGCVLCTEGA